MPSEAHQFRSLRLWSMVKKNISQPDLTEVAGATNMWRRKKCRKKQGWKCRKSAEDASESTFLWFGKGGALQDVLYFVCVCVFLMRLFGEKKETTDLVYTHTHTHTHTHIVEKTPWHIGVVNFLCLVQDLFLSTQISGFPSSPRQEHPITSYGTGKAFYTCGRCSAHQFRLADVPRRSP